MTPLNGPTKEAEKEPPKPPAPIKSHWIDRVARIIFPLVYFSFIVFYWIYYMNHPESALSAVTESHLESLILDTTNEVHLFALHFVYVPLMNEALDELCNSWNCHSLSTEGNLTPRQLWIQGMVDPSNSGYAAVASVHNAAEVNWDDYGIDESGPVPELQSDYSVSVPASPIHLSEDQLQQLQEVVDAARQAGDRDGLVGFLIVLHTLQQMNY